MVVLAPAGAASAASLYFMKPPCSKSHKTAGGEKSGNFSAQSKDGAGTYRGTRLGGWPAIPHQSGFGNRKSLRSRKASEIVLEW